MKLTKFPDSCDPNKMVQEESRRRFSICPCCGETERIYIKMLWPPKGWHGPAKGDIIGWFIPSRQHNWHIDTYKCRTCGAEWESDPYPTDLRNC